MKSCCSNRCTNWFSFLLLKYARPSLEKAHVLKPVCASWWFISSLVWKMQFPCFLTRISNFKSSEQFSTLPQFILNELCPKEDSDISASRSHVDSSLNDRALICIHGWWCAHKQWFLSPHSDFHDRCLFVIYCCLINIDFWPCTQRFLQILWVYWWYYTL